MRRHIAEDAPHAIGYDESRFANSLFYHDQSVDDAITIFDLNRRNFAKVLRSLPESAFGHPETIAKRERSNWESRCRNTSSTSTIISSSFAKNVHCWANP